MGKDVAVMVLVGVGMVVRHRKMLHYNITGVHVVVARRMGRAERNPSKPARMTMGFAPLLPILRQTRLRILATRSPEACFDFTP